MKLNQSSSAVDICSSAVFFCMQIYVCSAFSISLFLSISSCVCLQSSPKNRNVIFINFRNCKNGVFSALRLSCCTNRKQTRRRFRSKRCKLDRSDRDVSRPLQMQNGNEIMMPLNGENMKFVEMSVILHNCQVPVHFYHTLYDRTLLSVNFTAFRSP